MNVAIAWKKDSYLYFVFLFLDIFRNKDSNLLIYVVIDFLLDLL